MVLVATFNSLRQPLVLLVSIPFAATGPARTIGLSYRKSTARAQEFALLGSVMSAEAAR